MPRRARLAIANIAWHIIQRGNNRSACFFNDDDRHYYLHHLNEHAREFECARMVSMPHHYPWSSYAANAMSATNGMITPHSQYVSLGRASAERSECYRKFVASDVDDDVVEEIRHATQGNYVLGDSQFKKEVATALGRRVEPAKAGRPIRRQ